MMQQQYEIAFSIFFRHEFFLDGNLKCLTVKPSEKTAHMLKRAGAIMHVFQNGIHVLYEAYAAGRRRSRAEFLEEGWTLTFLLENTDASLFNYTSAFDMDVSSNYFYFENDTGSPDHGTAGMLHKGRFVSRDDIRSIHDIASEYFIKPFGIVRILVHKELENSFEIAFAGISTYWCYVLTQDYLQELVNPAIIHKETKQVFSGPEPIMLPNNKIAMAFFSTEPIAVREYQKACYQLVENYNASTQRYKVVLPSLPYPNRNHISMLKNVSGPKGRNYSYIFI
jgi:hypothetical protein